MQMSYVTREYWHGMIKMSLSTFFILRVLYTQPMHGYGIVRAVAELTEGCCSPTEGTVYPVLRSLSREGCVQASTQEVDGRKRRVYTLTPTGRRAFEVAVEVWCEITEHVLEASGITRAPTRSGAKQT
jgi:PadR family transcriptional regulator PadR